MNNRNNTQSLNGLKYFNHKSSGTSNDHKESEKQNSYIKGKTYNFYILGVLQTAQKKLEIRDVFSNHKNSRIVKYNGKYKYNFGK